MAHRADLAVHVNPAGFVDEAPQQQALKLGFLC
jgi:hypothetical protein